jgi:hypothetical protein
LTAMTAANVDRDMVVAASATLPSARAGTGRR